MSIVLSNVYIFLKIYVIYCRVRLLQLVRVEADEPIESRLPEIANTVNYIENVLLDWGTTVVSIELNIYSISSMCYYTIYFSITYIYITTRVSLNI